MAFEELPVRDETELENLVITNIEAVEPGLIYLDHQRKTEGGRLDILCVDQDGVFVVMELKNKEDDPRNSRPVHI
jgi:RecB family endonuclease NucS